MGIDHAAPDGLEIVSAPAVKKDDELPVVSTFTLQEQTPAILFDDPWLHARWSQVEIGTSAVIRKRREIADSIISRILSRYPLPIVYAVERCSGLSMLDNLDYGEAVQIAAEYVAYNGLRDGERPLEQFSFNGRASAEHMIVIEGMRRAVPSVYEVVHEWNGLCLMVRDLMSDSGREDHLVLYTQAECNHAALRARTLFTGRVVRFHEMAMPVGLLLPLSSPAAEALAHSLSEWSTANDRTSLSHRAVERTLHEYCIRAYIEDPSRKQQVAWPAQR